MVKIEGLTKNDIQLTGLLFRCCAISPPGIKILMCIAISAFSFLNYGETICLSIHQTLVLVLEYLIDCGHFGKLKQSSAPGKRFTSFSWRMVIGIGIAKKKMNITKLTYCRLFTMFYTAFSVISRLLSIFSLHSTAKNRTWNTSPLSNHKPVSQSTSKCLSVTWKLCHFMQKKRCIAYKRITTQWAKK